MLKHKNSKMTTNSQLSTTKPKNKNNWNRNRITEMEITWRIIREKGRRAMGEKMQGIRSINGRYKIDRGQLRIV